MVESSIHNEAESEEDRRTNERRPLAGKVVVWFDEVPYTGSGLNVSPEGVFFIADGAVRVWVQLEGRDPVAGEVVRVASMGNGQTGIAVAFPEAGA